MSKYVLGIDLGTSTTTVAVVQDGLSTVIPIPGEEDGRIMPSVVSFVNEGKKIIVGKKAKDMRHLYPFVPHEISVLVELILGHLRYLLTDVPPQPNSPPDNVFRPDRPGEAGP